MVRCPLSIRRGLAALIVVLVRSPPLVSVCVTSRTGWQGMSSSPKQTFHSSITLLRPSKSMAAIAEPPLHPVSLMPPCSSSHPVGWQAGHGMPATCPADSASSILRGVNSIVHSSSGVGTFRPHALPWAAIGLLALVGSLRSRFHPLQPSAIMLSSASPQPP